MFSGSPPLARDKFFFAKQKKTVIRITPACAGQIVRAKMPKDLNQDHPRLRGTNVLTLHKEALKEGSPPLARDKLTLLIYDYFISRITPACAGQIKVGSYNSPFERDHPRLRGTNCEIVKNPVPFKGSPPLARDK